MAAYTTIDDPEAYFQVKIYSGTGSSQAYTLDGDTDMQPDLVWIKERGGTQNNIVTDSLRGTNKNLYPDIGDNEATTTDNITAFGSDGFTLAGAGNETNGSSKTYVAWCWKESATAGFDILTFEGNTTAKTVSHNLSAVPHCMLLKNYDTTGGTNWIMYHHSLGNTYGIVLNENEDQDDQAHYWNDTTPTSSVFTVGDGAQTNGSADGASIISYLWSEKQGFSKFGSYKGNGNADGPFVYTGFRPAFLMVKKSSGTGNWVMSDNKRVGYNRVGHTLYANTSGAELAGDGVYFDLLSNGFKIRDASSANNTSGGTYIYMAFAEAPFVNSNGVPCNAR